MKKLIFISTILFAGSLLTGCSSEKHVVNNSSSKVSSAAKHSSYLTKGHSNKINLHLKYKGFKLASTPIEYRGTWYRANHYDKKATKLVITNHTINGAATYHQVDPNLKLDRHSEKQNKEYAGNAIAINVDNNLLKTRSFFDTVGLVYKTGQFKGHPCLFISYGTNPKAINGAVFKDKGIALKY
ncbi:hypothetical protein [Lactobacillus helveticus]|uniref:hypothetical protein n=1 Tax=Lactobacillus helveticus TaxID=1587 RepID=UPI00197C7D9E|nr:hypothetical protein [Lactobacillus helveticus]MBN6049551.1 hypothetical protein [Lactobacillus helveticus]